MAVGRLLTIVVALAGPGASAHASQAEPLQCSAGNQQDGVCSRPSALAHDHQLLQTKGSLSTVAQHQDEVRAPGDFGQNQRSASPCGSMQNVKRSCSGNGCKVLAGRMTGRTCRQYCQDSGLSCAAAWEEVNNDCNIKATMTCDQVWPRTSDLLCECAPAPARNASKLRLVWSDDFDGNGVDSNKWGILSAGGGFGNQEKQFYTNHAENVRVEQGVLKITAKCQEYHGHHYTSAKLQSKQRGEWGPGHRVEVRARLPKGRGTWPAIWMLPTDNAYGGWPHSGEIDIVEAVGCTQGKVYGTVHTGAYNHMKHTEKYNTFKADIGEWHTYAIEWTASRISWFIDGHLYHSFEQRSGSEKWPFDRRFFLILNLAVGGSWGGSCVGGRPSCSSHSEFGHSQLMEVDYARVYAL